MTPTVWCRLSPPIALIDLYGKRSVKADTYPDDNKFVDCAIVAGADYIVSENAHFRVLETIPFPCVIVKRLEEFIKDLQE